MNGQQNLFNKVGDHNTGEGVSDRCLGCSLSVGHSLTISAVHHLMQHSHFLKLKGFRDLLPFTLRILLPCNPLCESTPGVLSQVRVAQWHSGESMVTWTFQKSFTNSRVSRQLDVRRLMLFPPLHHS